MSKIESKIFSIGEAARICGVTVKQIRNWEERDYIPKLGRVLCGERSYRQFIQNDLDSITAIKDFLDQGYELRVAARKAVELNSVRKEENDNGNYKIMPDQSK